MRADDAVPAVLERLVVDGRLGIHDFGEGGTILVRVFELEDGRTRAHEALVVVGEATQAVGERCLAARVERTLRRIEQHLQRRESLLPVNDLVGHEIAQASRLQLEDDRTQEVLHFGLRAGEAKIRQPADVLPQRFSLLLLLPHIRPLEERNLQVLRRCEGQEWRPNVRFHARNLSGMSDTRWANGLPTAYMRDFRPRVSHRGQNGDQSREGSQVGKGDRLHVIRRFVASCRF